MAAPVAAIAGNEASKAAASAFQAIQRFLEQPLYHTTETTIWTNPKTGVVTTKSHGWSVSNGLALGGLLSLLGFEAALMFSEALKAAFGVLEQPVPGSNVPTWLAALSPATWPVIYIDELGHAVSPGTPGASAVATPPSALAAMDNLIATALTPGSALTQRLSSAALSKMAPKG